MYIHSYYQLAFKAVKNMLFSKYVMLVHSLIVAAVIKERSSKDTTGKWSSKPEA